MPSIAFLRTASASPDKRSKAEEVDHVLASETLHFWDTLLQLYPYGAPPAAEAPNNAGAPSGLADRNTLLIAIQPDRPMFMAISMLPNELRVAEPSGLRQGALDVLAAGRPEEEHSCATRRFGEAGKPRRLLLLVYLSYKFLASRRCADDLSH